MKSLLALVALPFFAAPVVSPPAAKAFWVDECKIVRDQYRESQAMLRATGAEMDRQAAKDGLSTSFQKDMLAQDKAMYEALLAEKGC